MQHEFIIMIRYILAMLLLINWSFILTLAVKVSMLSEFIVTVSFRLLIKSWNYGNRIWQFRSMIKKNKCLTFSSLFKVSNSLILRSIFSITSSHKTNETMKMRKVVFFRRMLPILLWICDCAEWWILVVTSHPHFYHTVVCILVGMKSFPRFWRNHP